MEENKRVTEEKEIEQDVESLIDGDRVINFSDAIFAFAATLLVLKIDLPQLAPDLIETQFTTELLKLLPAYFANFISFLIIAYYWRLHHAIFILIKRYDNKVIWINIFLLISVAFLPFPIDLFGSYSTTIPVIIFYTASITLVGYILLFLWLYASHKHRLIDKKMSDAMIRYHTLNIAIAPVVFTLSMPLVYIDHSITKISWLLVIVLLVVLNKFYKKSIAKKTAFNPQPI